MNELPLCACGEFYQAHHPECPARRAYERQSAENARLEAAAYGMFQHIQSQLEQEPGWAQYEFYQPEIDLYWLNQLSKALGGKGNAARWSELMAKYPASTRQCEHGKDMTDYCEPCGRIHSA